MSSINWEQKYKNLRANFLKSLDVSYRSGYEQGFNDASMEAMAQQAQTMQQSQAQMQQQAAPQQQIPQDIGMNPEEQQIEQAPEAQAEGSELDSQIATLESLVNKSEIFSPNLRKSISKIKTDVLGLQNMYNQNLSETQKQSVSAQEKMVNDIIQKWQSEQDGLSKDIASVLGTQFIIKE